MKALMKALYINFCFRLRIALLNLKHKLNEKSYLFDFFNAIEAPIAIKRTITEAGRAKKSNPKLSLFVPDE